MTAKGGDSSLERPECSSPSSLNPTPTWRGSTSSGPTFSNETMRDMMHLSWVPTNAPDRKRQTLALKRLYSLHPSCFLFFRLLNNLNPMSDAESSQEENTGLPNALEQLKGDNPTIFGYDYYKFIYGAAGSLSVIMCFLYFNIENDELKKMVFF